MPIPKYVKLIEILEKKNIKIKSSKMKFYTNNLF